MYYNIQITDNGTIAKAIYDFSTLESAKSNHFSFLASCYANSTLTYFIGEIIDADGNVVIREVYRKPEPEPEA